MNFIIRIIDLLTKRDRTVYTKKHTPTTVTSYSDHYNKNDDFTDDFYLNLKKTIAYTENIISNIKDISGINYCTVLRTTNPIYNGEPFYTFHENDYWVSPTQFEFDYSTVLSAGLSVRENTNLPQGNIEELGKILKFEIDITTHDGAPCSVNGFVDESDIPPIDTWFYITKKYLYCWIPTRFIPSMQEVIDVEIMGSYSWLEEENPAFNRQVFNTITFK